MKRWIGFLICAILGTAMLVCGLWVPVHLRAVDTSVIELAGRNTPSLVEQGLAIVGKKEVGTGQLISEAAQQQKLSGSDQLASAIDDTLKNNPELECWGSGDPILETITGTKPSGTNSEPLTDFVIQLKNREPLLTHLENSKNFGVQALLQFRNVTNTTIFPPSQSASGQALDAALSISGLLMEQGILSSGFSNSIAGLALQADHGGNSQNFEQVLMDMMSLGQRFNWDQLCVFTKGIQDPATLRILATLVRNAEGNLPVLFSAVELSGDPGSVAKYLAEFSKTGMADLAVSLGSDTGGLAELLDSGRRLYHSHWSQQLLVGYCLHEPVVAMTVKWLLYVAGGFLLAMSLHFAKPAASALERPLQVRGLHVAREFLFALGFLLVVLLISEPFLAHESQKAEFPFRLHIPTVGSVVQAGKPVAKPSPMNHEVLLTMLLFFVLQALLYFACLVKLAEIRRQRVPSRVKLKLLENEEHLFDAGLYLGFAGTIVSLILVSLGQTTFSLMAAYSSTSFGIVFVSVFKIVNLRPTRRRLLMLCETEQEAGRVVGSHSYAGQL